MSFRAIALVFLIFRWPRFESWFFQANPSVNACACGCRQRMSSALIMPSTESGNGGARRGDFFIEKRADRPVQCSAGSRFLERALVVDIAAAAGAVAAATASAAAGCLAAGTRHQFELFRREFLDQDAGLDSLERLRLSMLHIVLQSGC